MSNGDVDPGIVSSDADAGNIRCVITYYYERTKASSYHCFARSSDGVSTCARTHPVHTVTTAHPRNPMRLSKSSMVKAIKAHLIKLLGAFLHLRKRQSSNTLALR